ncbi:MAG: penicillin-binding protein [Bacilli bacterium]|nr:penicillin-binding protein [Bacilli bacterium]
MRKVNKRKKVKKLSLKEKLSFNKKKDNSVKNKTKDNKRNTRNVKNKDSNGKKKRSIWKKILTVLLIIGIIGIIAVTAFFGYIVLSSPEFNEEAFNVKDQTIVYDLNNEIIAKLGVENRESVTYDQLPQVLIDAIIATEDSRFFQHNGVDLPRFLKASVYQLMGRSDAGGASTLTMQMVKNSLTSTEDTGIKGIIRKFQDVYLSVFKVEKNYTKEEIIELYVNNHCLGSSIYGVGEASKYYFGKSVSELTLPEASLLAGLFQAPNRHNPYKNIESATSRRNTVLNLMVRHGYITEEEAKMAKEVSIESLLVGIEDATDYQGYIDNIIVEVIELTGQDPAVVPMKIYTTMEKKIQDGINSVINDNDASYWRDDKVQAGIAIINVETGAIAALSGQRNNSDERIFNFATEAYRQPGSTAKPIFAYGPGIEYNNNSTYTLFVDEPWSYTDGPSINNWDGKFEGIVTTRRALQVSRNIPALKAYQQVGSKRIQQFAYSLGLDVSLNQNSENYRIVNETTGVDNTINEAYSIGGVAKGFTPLEMAAAYSGFASGGYYTNPYSVTKIEFRETGETIEYKPTKERVMKDSTAYLMNNILESAVNAGFNGGARVYGSHVAAKTGTSNYPDSVMKQYKLPGHAVNDLWTVAYTSKYVVAVWYGYKDVSVGYNTSGHYKDNLTSAVMKYIPKDTKGWKQPSSVVAVKVEKESWPAKLPSEYTPSNMIVTEYFVKGTQPTEVSERYAKLNDIENTNVSVLGNSATITWEYTTPASLSDEYLDAYFSQSIFSKSKDDLIAERKTYNTDTLGDVGFAIYEESSDGTLTLLTYTNEYSYTYTGNSTTLVIKAEHSKYKTNASSGIRLNITLNNSANDTLIAALGGTPSITVNVGSYTELGIKTILYGSTDVTANATIKYQIINNNNITDYNTIQSLETAVNNLSAGTYTINYIINYDGNELIKNRTVTLK